MMGKWSDDSAYWVVHGVQLDSVLDTMVISGDDVCCSVVFGTLVCVCLLSVLWSELLMTSAISCHLGSSVYEFPESGVCVQIPGEDWVRYHCDVLYAVLYVRVSCFVVRGCAVSRRYINVCNCDMFSVVNVYLDYLKFCVVCIDGRGYVCCSECNGVSHHHLRVIKLVFSIFPHIFLLHRWTCWGHPMSRDVQEGCIASCVRCSLLSDWTHKSYLHRSTAISASVPCYMWILYVVDSGISRRPWSVKSFDKIFVYVDSGSVWYCL